MNQNYKFAEAEIPLLSQTERSKNVISLFLQKLSELFLSIVNFLTPTNPKKVVIVGNGSLAHKLYHFFNSGKNLSYKFEGFFDVDYNEKHSQRLVRGNMDDLKKYCVENEIDEIYFTYPLDQKALIKDLSDFADNHFIYFRIANPESVDASSKAKTATYYYDGVPVMALRREPLASRTNQILKRAFDIVFSFCVLCILIPFVFPIIALAIRLESRGPIFFIQKRPGYKNRLFGCMKFRSMTVNNNTEQQATKNDKRITKVGAFLRKTSLDELPQFINVLKGDMSVVGPRPNMIKQLEYYSQHIEKYSFRHFAMPGITGYAQVNGFRGETQTIDLMEKRVDYDIKYMEKWSLWFDIKIIFLTGWNIVAGEENAY